MPTIMIGAPQCSGTFQTTCTRCKRRCHHRTARRVCRRGHAYYHARGLCSRCYMRGYATDQLPDVHLTRTANVARRPRTSSPAPRRNLRPAPAPDGLINAPCDRCGQIGPLPYGPGHGLCPLCRGAETLDRALAPPRRWP